MFEFEGDAVFIDSLYIKLIMNSAIFEEKED